VFVSSRNLPKIMEMARGMMPRSLYFSEPPVIVKVLPEPVWP